MALFIGIMSGTSLDGVDVSLLSIEKQEMRIIASLGLPMPNPLRQRLSALHQGHTSLLELGQLNEELAFLYADAVKKFLEKQNLKSKDISAIGCHGQTVWHAPQGDFPFTMQLGNHQLLARLCQIPCIGDFRQKDMAYGGQGAPLVPAFHQDVFFSPQWQTAVLNIGGISNVSLLATNCPVLGFDTGPGNALMDLWIEKQQGKSYDKNGEWAEKGQILPELLAHFLQDPYFQLTPPKSTGREYFNLSWLNKKLQNFGASVKACDVQATLTALTAECSVQALKSWATEDKPCRLLLCGGGAKNQFLRKLFQKALPHWLIADTSLCHIDPDYVEAAAFAWLAYRRWHQLPSNLPSVTGASQAVSLGVIYYP